MSVETTAILYDFGKSMTEDDLINIISEMHIVRFEVASIVSDMGPRNKPMEIIKYKFIFF